MENPKAVVYIGRPFNFMGAAQPLIVYAEEADILGSVMSKVYVRYERDAGKTKIGCCAGMSIGSGKKAVGKRWLELDLEVGKEYYVKLGPGLLGPVATQLSDKEGKAMVESFKQYKP